MKKVILMGEVSLKNESNGVSQKFISQAKAFNELGCEVDCIGYDENTVTAARFENGHFKTDRVISHISNMRIKRFPLWIGIRKYMAEHRYDLAYIRYPIIDISVLKTLKAINKSCGKVVIEIPSYPLEIENATTIRKCLYTLDLILHNKCNKYVDKIVYVGNKTPKIFNCQAEQIPNGLPEQIKQTPCTGCRVNGNKIVLLCVSNMHPFHGYDRLLMGLADYYKNPHTYEVETVMVGDGPCREEYQKIVNEHGLGEHVRFTGLLKGEALSSEYKNATIGVGSLGMYREGFEEASSLKTKEYLVRGLPFVYAVKEIGLDDNFPYAFRMPNDSSPIRVDKIVEFAIGLLKDESSEVISRRMRDYAEERYSWTMILKRACNGFIN